MRGEGHSPLSTQYTVACGDTVLPAQHSVYSTAQCSHASVKASGSAYALHAHNSSTATRSRTLNYTTSAPIGGHPRIPEQVFSRSTTPKNENDQAAEGELTNDVPTVGRLKRGLHKHEAM
jgi:hypothetical protein